MFLCPKTAVLLPKVITGFFSLPKTTSSLMTNTLDVWEAASLMVSAFISGSSGPRSSPGREHCVVFFGAQMGTG